MKIDITARNFKLGNGLKIYTENEINSLEKHYDRILDCQVILEKVKNDSIAELILRVYGKNLVTKDTSDDMFKSVDGAAEKLRRRLKKYKQKLKDFGTVEKDFDHVELE